VRRALPLTPGTPTPESAPIAPQTPVNQVTQRDLKEAERLLNQAYDDLRQSLSPQDQEIFKLQELEWLKERNKVRNERTEYLRMTEERTQELNHMLTRGEH